jgi:hypothetical protein
MKICKYFNKHLETIREYISCLYNLEGCGSGGLLHILTDDDNYMDSDIFFCLSECNRHPEKEESQIGRLICEEYLRLPMEQRRLLSSSYIGHWTCRNDERCEECFIQVGDEYEE